MSPWNKARRSKVGQGVVAEECGVFTEGSVRGKGPGGSTGIIDVSIVMKVAKSCDVDLSSPRILHQWHTMVNVVRSALGGLSWSKH